MGAKLRFIEAASKRGANVSALCAEHGISRQTGHKWLRRYKELGPLGLVELSRRPRTGVSTPSEIVDAIVALRNRRPSWGPTIISGVLRKRFGSDGPSRTTVARVLRRLGRIKKRRAPIRLWSVDGRPHVEVHRPNDLWTIDFKGWWRSGRGERCEPFTVRDAFSRCVLAVDLVRNTNTSTVKSCLESLMRKHGVPVAIQCDNGMPWVNTRSRGGLTRLGAWMTTLGIRIVRSRVACPQDNGGHERMHRDLSELQLRPARSRRSQQREADRWRIDFNEVRPHAALAGKTPSEVYRVTEKRPLVVRRPVYSPDEITRRVQQGGTISVDGDVIPIGAALAGHLVGLRHERGLSWRVRFFDIDLGSVEIASLDPVHISDASMEDTHFTAVSP